MADTGERPSEQQGTDQPLEGGQESEARKPYIINPEGGLLRPEVDTEPNPRTPEWLDRAKNFLHTVLGRLLHGDS